MEMTQPLQKQGMGALMGRTRTDIKKMLSSRLSALCMSTERSKEASTWTAVATKSQGGDDNCCGIRKFKAARE